MANLFDYLKWRGDLSLKQAPFNEIDNLILARLSYLPFDGIVTDSFQETISIAEASDLFFRSKDGPENVIMRADLPLLRDVAANKRYAQMGLSGFINQVDLEDEKQFAALVIQMEPEVAYISYRGTDLSLAGWKEDFNMSFCTPVPSQEEAVNYLNRAAQALPGKFILGGHSKGGNLAVYAAAFCNPEVQGRILAVYNNDGPGFDSSILTSPGYQRISGKITTFIPQSSVVGMLLQHEEGYSVIQSSQIGLMQHDLFSWDVVKDRFVHLEQVDDHSRFVDQTLKTWLSNLSPKQREELIDNLFSIFEATNATTLKELTDNWHTNARILLRSYLNLDEEMRQNIAQILSLLFAAAKQYIVLSLARPKLLKSQERK